MTQAGQPRIVPSMVRLVMAAGIAVGMIVATRLDRIANRVYEPRDPVPEPRVTEEQQP